MSECRYCSRDQVSDDSDYRDCCDDCAFAMFAEDETEPGVELTTLEMGDA
jgi:hypothetical protein